MNQEQKSRQPNRRQFLKGAALISVGGIVAGACTAPATTAPAATAAPAAAAAQVATAAPAPICPPVPTAAPEKVCPTAVPTAAPVTWDKTADVVIVGGGGAGLVAAIEATNAGAKVIVLEKTAATGGTTNISGGIIQASGTKWQKDLAQVMDDTPAKHLEYWVEAGEGIADASLLKLMADNSAANLEWMASQGADYVGMSGVNPIPYITAPGLMVKRIHASAAADGKAGGGADVIRVLMKTATSKNIEIMLETPVTQLIRDGDNGIVGLIATNAGKTIRIKATKAVILATSSFDWNKDLARQFSPQQLWALTTGACACPQTSTGDGILLAMAVGANLAGMGGTIGYNGTAIGAVDNIPGIWVNKYGQRFVNENDHYAYLCREVFRQEEHIAWAVFDETTKALGGGALGGFSADLSKEITGGTIKTGKTIDEFAQTTGIQAKQLTATLNLWNDDMAANKDSLWGKTVGLKPFAKGPLYAVKVTETNLGSLGGVKINTSGQVLDTANKPIAHLYAAGTIVGNVFGPYYPGSGTALQSLLTFGRISGKNAAAETAA